MTAYHDREWGVPVTDDRILLEHLILDTFQAGLSWAVILHKREAFRQQSYVSRAAEGVICGFGVHGYLLALEAMAALLADRRGK